MWGGRPRPPLLPLRLLWIFPLAQAHTVAGDGQIRKSESKAAGEGARPTSVPRTSAPLARQL